MRRTMEEMVCDIPTKRRKTNAIEPEPQKKEICINLENVIAAIRTLNTSQNSYEINNASNFLSKSNTTFEMWEICHSILLQSSCPNERFYAAQTLRLKIRSSIFKLENSQQIGLKNSLLSLVLQCKRANEPKVFKQLCLTMANLYLMIRSWDCGIKELIRSLQKENPEALLTILSDIPEELNDKSLKMDFDTKVLVESNLFHNNSMVLKILSKLIDTCCSVQKGMVIKCLTNWMINIKILKSYFENNVVMDEVFLALQNPVECNEFLFVAAGNCIIGIYKETDENDFFDLRAKYLDKILCFQNSFCQCIQTGQTTKAETICYIIIAAMEFLLENCINDDEDFDELKCHFCGLLNFLIQISYAGRKFGKLALHPLQYLISNNTSSETLSNMHSEHDIDVTELLMSCTKYQIMTGSEELFEEVEQFRQDLQTIFDELHQLIDFPKIFNASVFQLVSEISSCQINPAILEDKLLQLAIVAPHIPYGDENRHVINQIVGQLILPNFDMANKTIKIGFAQILGKFHAIIVKDCTLYDQTLNLLFKILLNNDRCEIFDSGVYNECLTSLTYYMKKSNLFNKWNSSFFLGVIQQILILKSSFDASIKFIEAFGVMSIEMALNSNCKNIQTYFQLTLSIFKKNIDSALVTNDREQFNRSFDFLNVFLIEINKNYEITIINNTVIEYKEAFNIIGAVFAEDLWPYLKEFLNNYENKDLFEKVITVLQTSTEGFGPLCFKNLETTVKMIPQYFACTFEPLLLDLLTTFVEKFYSKDLIESLNKTIMETLLEVINFCLCNINIQVIREDINLINSFLILITTTLDQCLELFVSQDSMLTNKIMNLAILILEHSVSSIRINTMVFFGSALSKAKLGKRLGNTFYRLIDKWLLQNWQNLCSVSLIVLTVDKAFCHGEYTIEFHMSEMFIGALDILSTHDYNCGLNIGFNQFLNALNKEFGRDHIESMHQFKQLLQCKENIPTSLIQMSTQIHGLPD